MIGDIAGAFNAVVVFVVVGIGLSEEPSEGGCERPMSLKNALELFLSPLEKSLAAQNPLIKDGTLQTEQTCGKDPYPRRITGRSG